MTIEQTMNRYAKTPGGIVGLSWNHVAYYRWCVTRHIRVTYFDATLKHVDMINNCDDGYKTTRMSQIKSSECEVTNVILAFNQFLNPFNV